MNTTVTAADSTASGPAAAEEVAPVPVKRAATSLYAGMVHMKTPSYMDDALQTLDALAGSVASEPNNRGFDVFYANIPWKAITMDDLISMPIHKLCNPSSDCALFMWVDGTSCGMACELLATWGFRFHSIVHTAAFEVPENSKATPHGWDCDGLNVQQTRQLWYATRIDDNDVEQELNKTIRDGSFVRRRLPAMSTFTYTRSADYMTTSLSSKKKGLERWTLYPDTCAYVPGDVESALEKICKPNARVLSLFATGVHTNWFAWGPNVPGMLTSPVRGSDCFESSVAITRYFTGMKMSTVQRYLGLVNMCAVSLARSIGGDTKDDAGPVLETRLSDFFTDVNRRFTESGGYRVSLLNDVAPLTLQNLTGFKDQLPTVQTSILRLVAQLVMMVVERAQETAEKRAAEKRKASAVEGGEEVSDETAAKKAKRASSNGRHGIAAPVPISAKLASFMGLDANEQVARTTAVRFLNDYIRQNNLQNAAKRSEILLDEKLRDLLNPPGDTPVTYFSLSKLLVNHFPKKNAATAVSVN